MLTLRQAVMRYAVALGCGGVACLPWVDQSPNAFDYGLAALAIVAGVALVVSVINYAQLPAIVLDPAAALAAAVILADGFESIIVQEQRWPSIIRSCLFAAGAGLVALLVMVEAKREPAP